MTRTLMRYNPEIGTLYTPSLKLRVKGERGGYLVRTNAAGFRSEHEFISKRTPGQFRAIVFGDSQTAGDGVPNAQRFSDRLEQKIPGLEIYNYGISGTGPDQHFLLFNRNEDVERDLLIIVVYVENVRRVSRRLIKSQDSRGVPIFYAKPYFELADDKLEVRNVPVPKQIWSEEMVPESLKPYIYSFTETSVFRQITGAKVAAPRFPKLLSPIRELVKGIILRFPGFRILPEYNSRSAPGWIILRTILEQWIGRNPGPVVVVTIPHCVTFLTGRDPTRYRTRFAELASATGCTYYDFLPDLLKISADDRRGLWLNWSGHLSAAGHELLAELLAPVIQSVMRSSSSTKQE